MRSTSISSWRFVVTMALCMILTNNKSSLVVVVHANLYTICLPGEGAINDPESCDTHYDWVQEYMLPRCLAAGRFFNRAYVKPVLVNIEPESEEEVLGERERRQLRVNASINTSSLNSINTSSSIAMDAEQMAATDLVTIRQNLLSMLKAYDGDDEEDELEQGESSENDLLIEQEILEAAALDLQQRIIAFYDTTIMSEDEEYEVAPVRMSPGITDDLKYFQQQQQKQRNSFEEDVMMVGQEDNEDEHGNHHRGLASNKCKNCLPEQCKRNPIPPACCILCSQFNCCSGTTQRRRRRMEHHEKEEEEEESSHHDHQQPQQRQLFSTPEEDLIMEARAQATLSRYLETVNNLCTHVMRMKALQTGCFGDPNMARCTSYILV
jgi:hypothetical protein